MTVSDLCKKPVVAISSEANLQQAALLMQAKSVGCLVVIDAEEVPVGLITDRDIVTRAVVRGVASDSQYVGSVMTKNLVEVSKDAEIDEALEIMRKSHVRRLVVVEENSRRLLGILSADDLLLTCLGQIDRLGDIYFLQDKAGKTHFRSDYTGM
ncbi:MAG: cyclic nucleotide-binding/CBS domain-containing protein [Bacillota bacterium]